MTTPTKRPTRTVAATVMSKAETAEGFKLELQIPAFQGQFPTIVTRVPNDLAAQLHAGTAYNLVLEQQNVSKRRDGTPYDGSKPWMYYWGLLGIASPSDSVPETPPQGKPETRDATRISIERQSALKAAVEMAGYRIAAGSEVSAQDTLRVAVAFARFLETGLIPVAATASVSPSESPTTTHAPIAASRPASASRRPSLGPAGAVPTGQGGDPMPEDDDTPF